MDWEELTHSNKTVKVYLNTWYEHSHISTILEHSREDEEHISYKISESLWAKLGASTHHVNAPATTLPYVTPEYQLNFKGKSL